MMTTVTCARRPGARAIAGVFGRGVAEDHTRIQTRLRATVTGEGTQVKLHHNGALSVIAAGDTADPLESIDGCVCAIAGSLYELEPLAHELGLPPHASPTQIVVAGYRRLGTGMLTRLRGDFILLLWDEANGEGLLACDQMGGGTLFLCESAGELRFASELRNLLRLLPSSPAPDPVTMVHWLSLGGPPLGRTFFEGIAQLQGGHFVELDHSDWRVMRYWNLEYRPPQRVGRDDAAALMHDALMRAVRRCSGEGEMTGVLLSGGIDSAAVAGIAASCGHPPAGAYSAVFPKHPTIDESALIELLTSARGIPSFALPVLGGSVISGAIDYASEWNVPATSPNLFFWSAILRRAARDGVTAMLDGEGGDSLFWLSPYLLADRLMHGRLPSAFSLARRFPSEQGWVSPRVAAWLIREWGVKGAVPHWLHRLRQRLRGRETFAPHWFTPENVRLRFETDPTLEWKRSNAPRWWAALVNETISIGSTLVQDGARRRSASVGLQARHPLLDVDVIELMLALPPELAFDPHLSRPLLRDSVRGLIPEEVRLRYSKSSFDALFHELLAGPDLPKVCSLLLSPDAEVGAFVDRDRMDAELFGAGPPSAPGALQNWALHVWRLLTAEIWLRLQTGDSLDMLTER